MLSTMRLLPCFCTSFLRFKCVSPEYYCLVFFIILTGGCNFIYHGKTKCCLKVCMSEKKSNSTRQKPFFDLPTHLIVCRLLELSRYAPILVKPSQEEIADVK